jgi:hypothetical protein
MSHTNQGFGSLREDTEARIIIHLLNCADTNYKSITIYQLLSVKKIGKNIGTDVIDELTINQGKNIGHRGETQVVGPQQADPTPRLLHSTTSNRNVYLAC